MLKILYTYINTCNTERHVLVSHLMYADDLVICPSSVGLQYLLKLSSQYGIKYDAKKRNIMIVRSKEDTKLA